jgi:opacity protein-like surface antigen
MSLASVRTGAARLQLAANVWYLEESTMLKRCVMIAALALVAAPASARADWLLTPNVGSTFGRDASDREHWTYGVSFGWMGNGIIGWEADAQYTPEFFEANDSDIDFSGSNNVFTLMGNLIAGVPVGGQSGPGIRPFGLIGFGLVKQRIELSDENDDIDISNNDFGFNVGGGVMGFFNSNVGLRGDVRYVRSFQNFSDNPSDVFDLGDFDFWRANVGVVFRW